MDAAEATVVAEASVEVEMPALEVEAGVDLSLKVVVTKEEEVVVTKVVEVVLVTREATANKTLDGEVRSLINI